MELKKATPAQILQKILMDSWTLSEKDKDMIVMYHKFGYELNGKKHQIDANNITGLIPFSGHSITHFTVRKERGIDGKQPIIDNLAPLFHIRKDAPPYLMITGDRDLEMLGRYEENAYMLRMMKVAGHTESKLLELEGYGHNMTYPAFPLLLKEVKKISNTINIE